METSTEQAEKDALAAIHSKSAQAILYHVLSPIEKAALMHRFRPFRYNLNGAKIYMSGANSRNLFHSIMHKVQHLTFMVTKEQNSRRIPLRLREVFDDPREILGMPAVARNRLCAIECYTMYAAVQHGRSFFVKWPGFGRRSLAALDALFSKHKCTHLFK